ncbi:DUF1501 domain-containing protein, partial [Verrucomicrobiales bacterium]|nr:DUF1501 domain-containing protein [Verrucomicrobiales bacterium]
STCATMGINAMVNTLAHLRLMDAAANTAGAGIGNDYKALVCIFLRGGCDMNNVVIPIGANPQASAYQTDRGVVAVPEAQITNTKLNVPSAADQQFGLHPNCNNMASMFNDGDLAFVTNVGTLAYPTDPGNYGTNVLPLQLFSHSDQVNEWMSSISDKPFTSGWGGRIADLLHGDNQGSQTSMLITAAGNNDFLVAPGASVPQYAVTTSGAISLAGYGLQNNPDPYANALDANGNYLTNSTGRRLEAFERIMNFTHDHLLEEGYNTVVRRARENEAIITAATMEAANLNVDYDAIWNTYNANHDLGNQLKMVAQLIAGRACLGNKRQIFFCDIGGFDNHQDIVQDLPDLLLEVDTAVGAFNQALKEMAVEDPDFSYNDVTVFESSDFNRTWTPNGNDANTSGTDHAWGTHAFLFGGAVQGGQVYGAFPELAVGGADDVPSGSRGRWIPTTAVDQYAAVIAKWFGVEGNGTQGDQMATILPNLSRFDSPFASGSGLEFLDLLS